MNFIWIKVCLGNSFIMLMEIVVITKVEARGFDNKLKILESMIIFKAFESNTIIDPFFF